MLKKKTKPTVQLDISDLPPPIDARELKRKRDQAAKDNAQPTEPTQRSKKTKKTDESKEAKEMKPRKDSKTKKSQPETITRTSTRPKRRGVVLAPSRLRYTAREWTELDDAKLKAAVKKLGIPTPADASIKKTGIWYTAVSSWEKIAREMGNRSTSECRFRWYGPLDQSQVSTLDQ